MTREEEIKKEAMRNPLLGLGTFQKAFIRGAEWADRTMIEKACEWLEEFMQITPSKKTFIKRFKQAMKGE